MGSIIQISGGNRLNVGGLMTVGFIPPPIAWFAGSNSSDEDQSSSLYFFDTDVAIAGPMLTSFNIGSHGMHGNTVYAYSRRQQARQKYGYNDGTIVNQASGQNMGNEGHCIGNDVNAYETGGANQVFAQFRRFPYATETEINIGVTWDGAANARNRSAGAHANNTKGVVMCGGSPVRSDSQEFIFASETKSAVVGGLSQPTIFNAAMGSTTDAYICGGQHLVNGGQTRIDKHNYASNTNSGPAASLTTGRSRHCCASDASLNIGIVSSGSSSLLSTEKVNLANDTVSAGTNLDVGRSPSASGTSNGHAGLVP